MVIENGIFLIFSSSSHTARGLFFTIFAYNLHGFEGATAFWREYLPKKSIPNPAKWRFFLFLATLPFDEKNNPKFEIFFIEATYLLANFTSIANLRLSS